MKIEVNKEQLELLKYAILWYECNDEEEERKPDHFDIDFSSSEDEDKDEDKDEEVEFSSEEYVVFEREARKF